MLSVAALPGAWYWWSVERLSAQGLRQTLQREAVVAPLEKQVLSHLADWKSAQANIASVQERIKSMGETPDQWSHRTITIDNQRMSRVEVERYLNDLGTDQNNLLVPAGINVRAAKPGESIFATHRGQDSADALTVTIKAELYTRRSAS
ncbi:MAG: hypothetical protein ACOYNZ_12655 [Rhodoferax sp.]